MPLEAPLDPVATRVDGLNHQYRHHSATMVLEHALNDPMIGRIAMVSSFGAESIALLHMLSVIDRTTPVLFIDTNMLFQETLDYQQTVSEKLGLTDLRVVYASHTATSLTDPKGELHQTNPDQCCALRKTIPLQAALHGFDSWITGRKRYQASSRANLNFFEAEGDARIKVNPLAHWDKTDVQDYLINNRLPRHPLVAKGFASIGCAPCTSKVSAGEDPRAGRWRNRDKVECGIHFENGQMVRKPILKGDAA